MKSITTRGWIAVTKSGAPSKRELVHLLEGKTSTPKVHLEKEWTPPKGLLAKRVRVVITEAK